MRKTDKEITEKAAIESIIQKSLVCRLSLCVDNQPYIVPLCFGYKDNTLYFHSSKEGKKIEILKKNNRVCIDFDVDHEIVMGKVPCEWGMKYRSVIVFGRASFIEDFELKRKALDIITQHYGDKPNFYPDIIVKNTAVIKVEIESMTGKASG